MNKYIYQTDKLKRAMEQRGIGPKEISEQIEVSRNTINSIIATGEGHPEKVYLLAKYLGFPVKPLRLEALKPRLKPIRKTA